jgi:phosphoserine aminotransferase
MDIPSEYKVLFLQGGATMQFAQVPMNLLTVTGKADYIDSGNFASLAIKKQSATATSTSSRQRRHRLQPRPAA